MELMADYLANENFSTPAQWDAFVRGDEFKLAYILNLPCSGKPGAAKLTGAMVKRYFDRMSVKITFNETLKITDVAINPPGSSGVPLKDSRDLYHTLLAHQDCHQPGDIFANQWATLLPQWKAAAANIPNAMRLPRIVYSLYSSFSRKRRDEYRECQRCMLQADTHLYYQVTDDEDDGEDNNKPVSVVIHYSL